MIDHDELMSIEPVETIEEMEIVQVDERRVKLAEYLALGLKTIDIAANLSATVHWVRTHKKDPEVIAMVQSLQKDSLDVAKAKIIEGTARAAQTMIDLLGSNNEQVKLAAAKDLLDREGLKKTDKKTQESGNINVYNFNNMEPEELKANIYKRFKALESGD